MKRKMTAALHKLHCMQSVYDLVASKPGIGTNEICSRLLAAKSTALKWIRWVCDSGFIKRCRGGNMQDCYYVSGQRPSTPPEPRHYTKANEDGSHRLIVPAVNCGMKPDPFPLHRYFFGLEAA